jgi:hypothetical protein
MRRDTLVLNFSTGYSMVLARTTTSSASATLAASAPLPGPG